MDEAVPAVISSSPDESGGGSGPEVVAAVTVEASPEKIQASPASDREGADAAASEAAAPGTADAELATVPDEAAVIAVAACESESENGCKTLAASPNDSVAAASPVANPSSPPAEVVETAGAMDIAVDVAGSSPPSQDEVVIDTSTDGGGKMSLQGDTLDKRSDDAKEALNRLLKEKQKKLLELKMMAKEKQLAELRSKITTPKSTAQPQPVQKQEKRPVPPVPNATANLRPAVPAAEGSSQPKPVRPAPTGATKEPTRGRSRSRQKQAAPVDYAATKEPMRGLSLNQLQKDKIEALKAKAIQKAEGAIQKAQKEENRKRLLEKLKSRAEANGGDRSNQSIFRETSSPPDRWSGSGPRIVLKKAQPQAASGGDDEGVIQLDSEDEGVAAGTRAKVRRRTRLPPSQGGLRDPHNRGDSVSFDSDEYSETVTARERWQSEQAVPHKPTVQLRRRPGKLTPGPH